MKILFKGGRVFNPQSNNLVVSDLLVEGDVISGISANMPEAGVDRIVDAAGCVLMPGFKNAHAHTPMTVLRSVADDMNLEDWLHNMIFPREARLDENDVYYATVLGCMEYIKNGITACLDMYGFQDVEAKAFTDVGFRAILNCTIMSADGKGTMNGPLAYRRTMDEYERFHNYSPFVSYAFGVHSTYTTDADILRNVSKALHEVKMPFYTHMNETAFEARTAKEKTGMYNVEYLDSFGLLDFGGAIFHGIHMQKSELDILKWHNAGIVLNPCSNAKLNSGMADFEYYRNYGMRLGLGTDGASSNNSLDMFKEMWTLYAANHIKYDSVVCPRPEDIVYCATKGSADIMGLADCDLLGKGKKADIVMMDVSDVNAVPFTDFSKFLCYSANPSNVRLTMIAGRILYEDGRYDIGFDKQSVCKEVSRSLGRIDIK